MLIFGPYDLAQAAVNLICKISIETCSKIVCLSIICKKTELYPKTCKIYLFLVCQNLKQPTNTSEFHKTPWKKRVRYHSSRQNLSIESLI